jgi:hypothetical protein
MKKIFLSILAIAAVFSLSSCEKHKMHFDVVELGPISEFQLHYMEPINNVEANNITSVYVNGDLYSSTGGSGTLYPYNGIPSGGGGGRFFEGKIGSNHFQLYRGEELVYDMDVVLKEGKQNVIIYDLTKEPIIIDNPAPYWAGRQITGSNWNTDEVFQVQFVNLLFETPGVPYSGTLQYQYIRSGNILDPITGEVIGPEPEIWYNMGEPVAFGETTGFQILEMHKQTFNSSGSQRFDYRILTADGEELMKWNGSKFVKYTDYWTAYIGRVYTHFFRGNRAVSPVCNVSQWASM